MRRKDRRPLAVLFAGYGLYFGACTAPADLASETGADPEAGTSSGLDAAARPDADIGAAPADAGGEADGGMTDHASGAIDAQPDMRCQADIALPQRTDYSKPGPHAVATIELTFEDPSRPIAANETHPAAPSRVLPTTIFYPAAQPAALFEQAPLAQGGPFPVLMYSHGYSSNRDEGQPLASHVASHGYVVVAPEFPLTNALANGGNPDVTDAANQPGDLTFVLDQVLSLSEDTSHLLANAVDASRVGAAGLSLGGLTTLLVSFHPRLRDERIKAAIPIAALSAFFAEGFYHTRALPLLLIHGDLDAFIDYEHNARRAFMRAAPNARLVTVAKGTHAAFGAQLDPTTISLLNALIAPPDADPSNPDGLGCGAVGGTLSMTGPEFLSALGGPEDFIVPDDTELRPCQGDEYTRPAIGTAEQEEIAVRSAMAFLDAHLGRTPETRQDGCRYLLHEVSKMPAVTLE